MGRTVIVAYRPKPGREEDLASAVRKHLDILRAENLVTDRAPYSMRAEDGTLIEVFEWRSAEAIERAHAIPSVQKLWEEFAAVSEYVPLAAIPEAQRMFAEFDSLTG